MKSVRNRQCMLMTLLNAVLLLSGCASMSASPDYQTKIQQEQTLPAWSQSDEAESVISLNSLIASAQLNQLVETAIQHNPTLQQTCCYYW